MNYIEIVTELNDLMFNSSESFTSGDSDIPLFSFNTTGYRDIIEFENMVVFDSECTLDIIYDENSDRDNTQEEVIEKILIRTKVLLQRLILNLDRINLLGGR